MGLCALVGKRNVAITVQELSMRCGSTELPFPLDDKSAERFTAGGKLSGGFEDAVSGEVRSAECDGLLALSVTGNRLLGIMAPIESQPAVWFSVALTDVSVEVVETSVVRKKPVTVRLSFDSVVVLVTAIHRLLKTVQQSGQGGALVDALRSRATTSLNPGFDSPVSARSTGSENTATAGLKESEPERSDLVDIGGAHVAVEVRNDLVPLRSALWGSPSTDEDRAASLSTLLQSLVYAGYPDRLIVHGFLDPIVQGGPLDSADPVLVPWADRLPSTTPSGPTVRVLPPIAVILMCPEAALRTLAGGGPLGPWARRLVHLAEEEPLRWAKADLFRYHPPDPTSHHGWDLISLGRNETDCTVRFTGDALVARYVAQEVQEGPSPKVVGWLTTMVSPEFAAALQATRAARQERSVTSVDGLIVVPTETISHIELKANFEAPKTRGMSEESKRLAATRGYGVLTSVDASVTTHDGWRPVKIGFVARSTAHDDAALLQSLTWWVSDVIERRSAAVDAGMTIQSLADLEALKRARPQWSTPTLVKGVGTWVQSTITFDVPGAGPLAIELSELTDTPRVAAALGQVIPVVADLAERSDRSGELARSYGHEPDQPTEPAVPVATASFPPPNAGDAATPAPAPSTETLLRTPRRPWAWGAVALVAALLVVAAIAVSRGGDDSTAVDAPIIPITTTSTTTVPAPLVVTFPPIDAKATATAAADGSLLLELDGVGTIVAPAGALLPGAQVSAATVAGVSATQLPAGFQQAAPAIEVSVADGALQGLLQLSIDVSTGPTDAVPVVLHLDESKRWSLEQPEAEGSVMTLWAGEFSFRLFGWIRPADWVNAVGGVADSIFDWAVGRTDPPPDCTPDDPYPWVSAGGTVATGAVHACALRNPRPDGTERVEIKIKSNRTYYQWVHLTPRQYDYLWVEGLPIETRRALAIVTPNGDYQYVVLLAPGKTMTVGYLRPVGSSADLRFDVSPDATTLAMSALAKALGEIETTEMATIALHCIGAISETVVTDYLQDEFDLAGLLVNCPVSGAITLLEDFTIQTTRFKIAGGVATGDDLEAMSQRIEKLRTVEKLKKLGSRFLLGRDVFNTTRDLTIELTGGQTPYANTYSVTLIPVRASGDRSCRPVIATVDPIRAMATQAVRIAGSCLGSEDPYTGANSSRMQISNLTKDWNGCYGGDAPPDSVTCSVSSWTDSVIVLTGFDGAYGNNNWIFEAGDTVRIRIWPAAGGTEPAEYVTQVVADSSTFANGGFEEPDLAGSCFVTVGAGDSIGPWTVGGAGVDHLGSGTNFDNQSIDLSGPDSGSVSQTFATAAGTSYRVRVKAAANVVGLPNVKTFTVAVNATGAKPQEFSTLKPGGAWCETQSANAAFDEFSYEFTASASTTMLTITSTTAGRFGPVIDDVRVERAGAVEGTELPVPDSAEWTLFDAVQYRPTADGGFMLASDATYWPGARISMGGTCDYRVDVDARLISGDGYGIYVRTTFAGSAPATGHGFQYNPGASGLSDHEAPDVENGKFIVEPTDSGWHHLSVEVSGDHFRSMIDDRVVFEGTTVAACGDLWLRVWRTSAEFKNLQLRTI